MPDGSNFFDSHSSGDVDVPTPVTAGDRGESNRCEWCQHEVQGHPCAHWDQFCSCSHAEDTFTNLEQD